MKTYFYSDENEEYTLLVGSADEIHKEFETRIAKGYFFRYVEDPIFIPGRTYGLIISKSDSIDSDFGMEVIGEKVVKQVARELTTC
ncbi:hypothetical protein [Porcincola intestinalis]|uniref:Uncharacterized protein n=1 Tax=Porcincola intestinalis TaxID=2606632 RepID=A0A6L5X845_9FIRM|nr:hypothetical protein [Porcincola intestinalis]MSS15004.1 hypothetical protein [Porcincola intestinalis]